MEELIEADFGLPNLIENEDVHLATNTESFEQEGQRLGNIKTESPESNGRPHRSKKGIHQVGLAAPSSPLNHF
jgi:hypothetical protein